MLAATAAELAGAAVTAKAAREGRVEPVRPILAPLDVLCQQLIGMACADDWGCEEAFALVRRAGPMAGLDRADFDACLSSLAGDLPAPAGAFEPEPGAAPKWTSPRIWREKGRFGLRSRRVLRWFRGERRDDHLGGVDPRPGRWDADRDARRGVCRASPAGRPLRARRPLAGVPAGSRASRSTPGRPAASRTSPAGRATVNRSPPSWGSTSPPSATMPRGCWPTAPPPSGPGWGMPMGLSPTPPRSSGRCSRRRNGSAKSPAPGTLLVEESPHPEGMTYSFHAPLCRAACEALGRAFAARLGRRCRPRPRPDGRRPRLVDPPARRRAIGAGEIAPLLALDGFDDDVMEGLDRGELLARRFRHVAGTALMVLRRPEGGG